MNSAARPATCGLDIEVPLSRSNRRPLLFGGATLHYFALALTIGILFGIYSSVFVAAAIAMWLGIKREDLIKSSGGGGKKDDPSDPNAGAVV